MACKWPCGHGTYLLLMIGTCLGGVGTDMGLTCERQYGCETGLRMMGVETKLTYANSAMSQTQS